MESEVAGCSSVAVIGRSANESPPWLECWQAAVQTKSELGRMRFELESSENENAVLKQNAAELNARIENMMGVINAKHDANQKLAHSEEARIYAFASALECDVQRAKLKVLPAIAGPPRQARASPLALGASTISECYADDACADT